MKLKAVMIGDPDHRACAYKVEELLLDECRCTAVWNPSRMPRDFGPLVRILSCLPALIVCDIMVVFPSYRKRWSSMFEYFLGKILMKIIVRVEDILPADTTEADDDTFIFKRSLLQE